MGVSVGVISAAALAYEVLLIRLFAIIQWHHFAYMAISIALLGFGASGTFLFLAQGRLRRRFVPAFAVNAALFGVTALFAFVVAQHVPFNALAVLWQPRQLLYLGILYCLFAVPFFTGANCIGLALMRAGDRVGTLYAANLTGSGLGALGVVAALFVLAPADALRWIAGIGLAAGAPICLAAGLRRCGAALAVISVVGPLAVPSTWTELRISPYKSLSAALATKGAEVVDTRSSPLGLLTVVRSPAVPFRHVPGLSLNATQDLPDQLAVFTDGDGLSAISAFGGSRSELAFLDFTPSALPYHLLDGPSVLVLGAGGGMDVLQAIYHRAPMIDAVELNPQMVDLLADVPGAYAGGLLSRPDVRVHVAEARSFLATAEERWDLIQMPMLDSSAAAAAGVHALAESHLYTVEALRTYLRRLRPGGILAVSRWLKLPPRDSLKLFATALAALTAEGAADPARHLVLVRSWNTTTLLVGNAPFADRDIAAIRTFAADRAFDLAYYPGMRRAEANRHNILTEPYFHDGAVALAAGAGIIERYKFDIRPATDDRPYFFDFFKWRSFGEFARLRGHGGAQLLELGYPILLATLGQGIVLSALLILLPLRGGGAARVPPSLSSLRVLGYFAALGLAFLFVEIAFIQRFVLFLGHPLYATAVVLCAFLVFAGLGSAASGGLGARSPGRLDPVVVAAGAVALLAVGYVAVLPALFAASLGLSTGAKIAITIALIAPLAFFMGMPFPLGLRRVARAMPELVPWAWGVNGCFSVLSAVLATLLAIHLGFTMVVALAAGLYLCAGAVLHAPLDENG
jgi:spermidine synthase